MCGGGGGVSSVTCPVGSHSTCKFVWFCVPDGVSMCVCVWGGGVSSVTCPVGSHSTCNICLVLCSRWYEYVCVCVGWGGLFCHMSCRLTL